MLPKLTVNAKIIYLLMVVISGALCTVEDYVIMSQCAHNKAINLAAEGTVSVTDISKTQNITIVGLPDYINNDFKITLYAKDTQRYLCFNENWKLVGMRELRETCYFNETIVHGYFVFRSVVDLQRRVGFTHRGKAIGPRKNVTDACYLFTKIHSEQFFHQHTTPKTKATTYASSSSGRTTAATAATAATTTSKSKGSRNNRNKNNYDRSNGMRNTSDNQNRQHVSRQESNTSDSSSNTNISAIITQQHSTATNVSNTHRQQQQQQQQQHHQVRHHHNDPNVVARRHQHEHKQKQKQRRQRNRTRATTSPTTTGTPTKSITKPTTTHIGHRTAATATTTAFNSNKATAAATSAEAATQAAKTMSTKTETNSSPTTSATTTTTTTAAVAHKRKGRRRKGNKMHKQPQHHMLQQQLPVNAKDPQHRRAHKKALHVAATQPAVTHQQPTNSSVVDDDVPAAAAVDASAARGTVASAVDYSSLSTDWSSMEPTSTTTAESLDYVAASSSSSTVSLLPLPSAWTPRQSSPSAADVDASSALLPTDSESSMLPATADTISSATYKLGNVAATSTLDSNAIYASAATNTQPALDELFGSAFGSKPTATTYDATNTWAAATLFDDLATTQTDAAAPTPWLTHSTENRNDGSDSWISTSSSTTETESNSSSSSSSDSFDATEELSDIQATAETKTIDGNDDVLAESGDATSRSSSNTSASSNENENFLLNLNNQATIQRHVAAHTEQQRNSSPNKNVDSVAATFPTWQTTQTNTQKLVASAKQINKQPTTKTTTFRQEAATGSSGTSTSNNLDYSTTDYLFSTRSSSVRNKNHKHRQQQQQQQQEQQQQQQQQHQHHQQHIASNNNNNNALKNPHKNTQFLSPKATHNKHHVKLSAPAATFKTAATYLPATIGTTLVSSNPLDLLFGITWPQNTAGSEYDSLRNVHHKNINNNQHNTLLDYSSASSSSSSNSSSLTSDNAITPTTATRKHLRKSTQKLLATPFHQLTYVRNHDGDIDIDNIDNISVYSDLSEADVSDSNSNGSTQNDYNGGGGNKNGNSRMTIVSGYLPTSATATLPESIRIAKIKINKVRKRMLRQRYVGERA